MTDIRVPQLAEGVNSGTVVSILVQEGDEIQKDQTILELETEKAVAPIPASSAGKIGKILVKEGDAVNVGQVVIQFAGANGSASTETVQAPAAEAPAAPDSSGGSKVDVRVPQLAEGITSGTVVSIAVSVGEKITKDQTLVELETEKAVAPIPSTVDGEVADILIKEGDAVNVGQAIISVMSSSGAAPAQAAAPAPQAPTPTAPVNVSQPPAGSYQYQSATGAPPPASPSVRKMAKQLGIDLTRVQGSANGGRITLDDLKAYIQRLQSGSAPAQGGGGANIPFQSSNPAVSLDFSKWGPVKKEPMTMLRKKIAEKMVDSWTTIPHVTQYDDVDITDLLALRKSVKDDYEKAGARLTVTSFVFKAVGEILKQYPLFNASIDEVTNEVVYKDYVHVGMAVDTEQGLIVPVIRDVDKKNLVEISQDIAELAQKTRDRKVAIEDMQGGTFTISNQGGIGGDHFTPIINKPEVAILGVGQASQKYVVIDDKPQVRTIMPLALSYDHRLIDGGKAARFITDFVKILEGFSKESVKLEKSKKKGKS